VVYDQTDRCGRRTADEIFQVQGMWLPLERLQLRGYETLIFDGFGLNEGAKDCIGELSSYG